MAQIYILVGCPGAGKTWVTRQLGNDFHLVHHDARLKRSNADYVEDIHKEASKVDRPVVCEAPFSISEILDPLKQKGHDVTPLFIQESDRVIADRYQKREGKPIPQGHLSRQQTYRQRADQLGAFAGTSEEVATMLRSGRRTLNLIRSK